MIFGVVVVFHTDGKNEHDEEPGAYVNVSTPDLRLC